MSAAGRLVGVADGRAVGVSKTGADSVVTGTEALAALLAAGTAVPVPEVGGRVVAAAPDAAAREADAVAPEADAVAPEAVAVAREADAAAPEAGVAAGLAVTADWEVPGVARAAAAADEATALVAAGMDGVWVTAGGAWLAGGAAGWLGGLPLAVGVA
jgi:hypothetical protein